MDRIGSNPFKENKLVKMQQNITVAVLNFIPFLSGYFSEGLPILKLCLESIRRNTQMPFDLLVFDNGSDPIVIDYLLEERANGKIDYLILSEANVGKVGAWDIMLKAAPGKYVAYTDGDVFFFPGWLEASLKIIDTFPRVGMVTSMPMRHLVDRYTESTIKIAKEDANITEEKGDLISREKREFFCEGVGMDYSRYMAEFGDLDDIRLTCNDVQAFVGSTHFQFVMRKEVIDQVLPLAATFPLNKLDDRKFDQAVSQAGFMRLSVTDPYVQHIGNNLTEGWQKIASEFGIIDEVKIGRTSKSNRRLVDVLRENLFIRRILFRLYNDIFKILYGNKER